MKRLMILVSVAIFAASPVHAQGVYTRDVRLGATRVTEITQAPTPATPQAREKVSAPAQPAAPQAGDPKTGKVNGQVAPAAGKVDDANNPQAAIRDAQTELAAAIRALNPSYAIAPVIGNSSASAGSYYIRSTAYPFRYSTQYDTTTGLAIPPLGLPAPVYLGSGYPYSYPYWNGYPYSYGYSNWYAHPNSSWLYSGTIRLDVAPDAPIDLVVGKDARTNELMELRQEVHKLRKLVEKLSEREK